MKTEDLINFQPPKSNLTIRMELFLTAFLQVCLVSMNVVFISHGYMIPMLLTGFGISLTWTFNVKKVAFGTNADRVIYATGAMFGTGIGYYITQFVSYYIMN